MREYPREYRDYRGPDASEEAESVVESFLEEEEAASVSASALGSVITGRPSAAGRPAAVGQGGGKDQPSVLRRFADMLAAGAAAVCGGCAKAKDKIRNSVGSSSAPAEAGSSEAVGGAKRPLTEEEMARERARMHMRGTPRLGGGGRRSEGRRHRPPRRSAEDRLRDQAQMESGILVDATLEVLSPSIMRSDEDMDSAVIAELRIGEEVVVRRVGAARRIQVKALQSDLVGWVSHNSRHGTELLKVKFEAPGEGFCPGAVGKVAEALVKMRADEDLDSPEVGTCRRDDLVTILERGVGRRVKIERQSTGEVGWVSVTAQGQLKLLHLHEEAPWRKKDFDPGCKVYARRDVILRAEEAMDSAQLMECKAGQEFIVIEAGQGTRLKVENVADGTVGWVSSSNRLGFFLLEGPESDEDEDDSASSPSALGRRAKDDLSSNRSGGRRGGALSDVGSAAHAAIAAAVRGNGDCVAFRKELAVSVPGCTVLNKAGDPLKALAAVGYTSGQARTTMSRFEDASARPGADKTKLPPGAQDLPPGCLCCMFTKIKYVRAER